MDKKDNPTTFTGVVPQATNPFSRLPDLMMQILGHEENADINMSIEQENGLTPKQGNAMMNVIRKIVLQTITPAALVTTIKTDLGLDEPRAKKLALDLLGWRFLPMEWYLGPIKPLIEELGGNADAFIDLIAPLYPEVFPPSEVRNKKVTTNAVDPVADLERYLHELDHYLKSFDGQAEVLLRLTTLGEEIETGVTAGRISRAAADKYIVDLDAVSSMINSQDLNPFEVQAIRRRLTRLLGSIEGKI